MYHKINILQHFTSIIAKRVFKVFVYINFTLVSIFKKKLVYVHEELNNIKQMHSIMSNCVLS